MKDKQEKWECWDCSQVFKTKRDLIEHLQEEIEEGSDLVDRCINQLDEMGIIE